MSSTSIPHSSSPSTGNPNISSPHTSQISEIQNPIPSQLKFLMLNIKSVINTALNVENYPIWKAQILKLFTANGYEGYLNGSTAKPTMQSMDENGNEISNLNYQNWMMIDQNLAAALYSVISPNLLPYILNLNSCAEIWRTLERRLQSTSRSRLLQLKNELHHLTMKDKTMLQYLSELKSKCDAISATGSSLDPEDVILYTLNGLPPQYQAFKTTIQTNLQPISLDDFYALLCSEELNLAVESAKENTANNSFDPQSTFAATRGRGRYRFRGQFRPNTAANVKDNINTERNVRNNNRVLIECQICFKPGHAASDCWHRSNLQYQPAIKSAYITSPITEQDNWILDSGATSHLTPDINLIQHPQKYEGTQQIKVGNGDMLPIAHSGQGYDEQSNTFQR